MQITCNRLVQGEERDSSDEEWADAYATMDPISQLGWRNRRGGVEGPAEQLMRDVMEVADVVHSDAMCERAASRNTEEEAQSNAEEEAQLNAGERIDPSMSRRRGSSPSPTGSEEVDQGA
jgi:hypothetical protein